MKEIFMKEALKEAQKAFDKEEVPVGAVIVKDGKIIARAHNIKESKKDSTCHAELLAIQKACKKLKTFDLTGCEIYTTGYPCPMCFCAILWANINKVYYGCNTTDTKIIGFRDKEFEEKIHAALIEAGKIEWFEGKPNNCQVPALSTATFDCEVCRTAKCHQGDEDGCQRKC